MISNLIGFLFLMMTATPYADFTPEITLEQEHFIFDNPPFAECHASTIVETGNGKLMASWFAGTRESNPDVTIWTAVYDNGKWGQPVSVANGIINDTLRYPCWNPVLFRTKAGKLLLFYKVGKNPREWWGMLITSSDDGKTWSEPERLPDGFLGPIKNKPMQLKNGNLLLPSSTESQDEKTWQVHLEQCDKNGKNWKKIPLDNVRFGAIQPCILRYSKKDLQLLARSRENVIVQSWSKNNGKTWTPLAASDLVNPNSGIDAVSLNNDRQLLVYNPYNSGKNWWEGRNKLVVAVSLNGTTWKDVYTLEEAEKGEFSYPAVIQTNDGSIHITYTSNRKNIRHVVLKINDPLTDPTHNQ